MAYFRKTGWASALICGSVLSLAGIPAFTSAAAQSPSGPTGLKPASLKIENFVGKIEIKQGTTLSYTLDMREGLVPEPAVSGDSQHLVLDGRLAQGPSQCQNTSNKFEMKMQSGPKKPISAFPELVIVLPANSDVEIGQLGGLLSIGDTRNLSLAFQGCGDAVVGDVAEALDVAISGSGDVTAGQTGRADIAISGSGDFSMDDAEGDVNTVILGSGDVKIREISGETSLSVKGSGDIDIGTISDDISVIIQGSGDVSVHAGTVGNFRAEVMGSGDIAYKGDANDVSVLLKGSGDVYVARSTGNRVVKRHGSGDVRIGSWQSGGKD